MQVPRAPRGRAQTQGLTTASSLQVRASPSCAQTAGAGEGDAGVSPSEPWSHVQRAWVWDSGEWGCCEICLPPRVQMGFLGEPMPRQACGWRDHVPRSSYCFSLAQRRGGRGEEGVWSREVATGRHLLLPCLDPGTLLVPRGAGRPGLFGARGPATQGLAPAPSDEGRSGGACVVVTLSPTASQCRHQQEAARALWSGEAHFFLEDDEG